MWLVFLILQNSYESLFINTHFQNLKSFIRNFFIYVVSQHSVQMQPEIFTTHLRILCYSQNSLCIRAQIAQETFELSFRKGELFTDYARPFYCNESPAQIKPCTAPAIIRYTCNFCFTDLSTHNKINVIIKSA